MVWAQAFPFVALSLYDGGSSDGDNSMKENITLFLITSFSLWLLLNLVFLCTIDLSFIWTFVSTQTAPQYTVDLYETSEGDFQKFDAVFSNRLSYTKSIHEEVKEWVRVNVSRWIEDKPEWFKIEAIPDNFLPVNVFVEEGGFERRRSNVSVLELVGLENLAEPQIHPAQMLK